jgi:hypothetical protein
MISGDLMGIKIIDGAATDLSDLIAEASKKYSIEFGVREDAGPKNIMKAIINEFGYDSPGIPVTDAMRKYMAYKGYPLKKSTKYIKIPARPFISTGIEENLNEIFDLLDNLTAQVHAKKTYKTKGFLKKEMEQIGELVIKQIQDYMNSNNAKANHPMTIEGKGHSNPLVGSGELRDALGYEIIRK